ncbi:three component ABC system middle component [Streptomyces erythrochromogenes]|uniref:three component ABC system middle component n=1 Tax=Streptomyces erythrochromogenes TaxID=285574 RepID=UPI0037FD058C
MTEFSDLSRDERALYNPVFTGLVVGRAVQGHQTEFGSPCPVVVAVLAAVMALQPAIRTRLPRTTASGLHRWVQENTPVKTSMAQNASAVADVVRPGLLTALQTNLLSCDGEGQLYAPKGRLKKGITGGSEEVVAIQKSAHLLGRWLPSTGSISTVMTLLGVRP